MKFNLIWNFEKWKKNIFSFSTIRCAHFISLRCTNTYISLLCFLFLFVAMRLWWCGRHSAICDLGNENAFLLLFLFPFPLEQFFSASFFSRHRHTNAGECSLALRKTLLPFFVCYMHKYHAKWIFVAAMPRAKQKTHEKNSALKINCIFNYAYGCRPIYATHQMHHMHVGIEKKVWSF